MFKLVKTLFKIIKSLVLFVLFFFSLLVGFPFFIHKNLNQKPVKTQQDLVDVVRYYHSYWPTKVMFWLHAQLCLGGNIYRAGFNKRSLPREVAEILYEKDKLKKVQKKILLTKKPRLL